MESQPTPSEPQQPSLQHDRKVWGKLHMDALWQGAINDQSGFVAVPLSLLRLQSRLELTATDMMVVINLLFHRWAAGAGVFPRTGVIAKRMGTSERSVQRSIKRLMDMGAIIRSEDESGKRVLYLEPLVAAVAKATPMTISVKEPIDT